jgi:putative alpha-1,2-mannosidase
MQVAVAFSIILSFNIGSFVKALNSSQDLTRYVNPFIGTEGQGSPGSAANGGNVFPGAALPFGVVKFGIDTTAFDWTNVDANAGYTPDGFGKNIFAPENWCSEADRNSHGIEYAP